jgi:peptidoglycan hydrolase CwlO-like protein
VSHFLWPARLHENFLGARMASITKGAIGNGLAVLAVAVVVAGILFLIGDAIIKTPIQWYNGACSKEYAEKYLAKFRWFEPTCVLPDDSVISEDDIDELQNKLTDLQKQLEETQQRLKNTKKRNTKGD